MVPSCPSTRFAISARSRHRERQQRIQLVLLPLLWLIIQIAILQIKRPSSARRARNAFLSSFFATPPRNGSFSFDFGCQLKKLISTAAFPLFAKKKEEVKKAFYSQIPALLLLTVRRKMRKTLSCSAHSTLLVIFFHYNSYIFLLFFLVKYELRQL